MIDKTIAIYVFIDEILKKMGHQEDIRRKITDAEILTTAIVGALYFGGHTDRARCFMHATKMIPNMLDKSRFNRRLHAIGEDISTIFLQIGRYIKDISKSKDFILDSFPVPVCDNIRISRSKLVKDPHYRGWQASMKRYFYGIKVQLLTTETGIPVEFYIVPGGEGDAKGLYQLPFDLPEGSNVYADAAYTNYEVEDMLKDEGIFLKAHRKKNSKRKDDPWVAYLKKLKRKIIETSISGIKSLFLRTIHAVTFKGFLIKIFLFLLAFQLDKAYF